jgi:hypothetical protein
MNRLPVVSFASRALAVVAALGFITACGDVDTYKVRTSPWEDTESLTNLEGRLVRLVRATSLCDSGESEELLSLVGSHTEFPGEDVATLKSSCSGANEANVSIDLDAKSIIYDFSNVAGSGMFASADFNGYVFDTLARSCGEISSATVDRNLSNLALNDDDLVVDGHTLRANFAGLSFDETTFVKIDLVFADAD